MSKNYKAAVTSQRYGRKSNVGTDATKENCHTSHTYRTTLPSLLYILLASSLLVGDETFSRILLRCTIIFIIKRFNDDVE